MKGEATGGSRRWSAAAGIALLVLGACAPAPGLGDPSDREEEAALLVPAGYGTLFQDQFTLELRSGNLLIKVTPLDETVIRLAAPDTYTRLRGLANSNRRPLETSAGVLEPALFLVSFFSRQPNLTYEPEDLQVLNRGRRYRPLAIRAVTPGWGGQRLGQEETQLAVYAFDPSLDLEIDLAVDYQGMQNAGWTAILSTLRAERARVRARVRR